MNEDNTRSDLMEFFEPFDEEWRSTTRSIRIDGTVTSVRLENFYWRVVSDIAERQGLQIPQLMTRLSKVAKGGDTKHSNFTSFVRVCCGRYLDREIKAGKNKLEGGNDLVIEPEQISSAIKPDHANSSSNSIDESASSRASLAHNSTTRVSSENPNFATNMHRASET